MEPSNVNDVEERSEVKTWPKKTTLVASDSLFNQIDEKRLNKEYNVKVRAFNGASINDMYWYLHPLLERKPDLILLHVGTNDINVSTSDGIIDNLLELKLHIENILPDSTVILSQPIIRTDTPIIRTDTPIIRTDTPRATRIIIDVIKKFNELNIIKMDNSNIERINLGRKGLHLNDYDTRKLAMNIISLIRSF